MVFAQRGHKPRTKAFVDAIAHEDKSIEMLSGLSLKFLPQKSDFPSHEPEFEVPRSVYILI